MNMMNYDMSKFIPYALWSGLIVSTEVDSIQFQQFHVESSHENLVNLSDSIALPPERLRQSDSTSSLSSVSGYFRLFLGSIVLYESLEEPLVGSFGTFSMTSHRCSLDSEGDDASPFVEALRQRKQQDETPQISNCRPRPWEDRPVPPQPPASTFVSPPLQHRRQPSLGEATVDSPSRLQQHKTKTAKALSYYRVIYRGIISLPGSPAHLGYGDIFSSTTTDGSGDDEIQVSSVLTNPTVVLNNSGPTTSIPRILDDISLVEPCPKPRIEHGPFTYRILSASPLAVRTGPLPDAPVTQAQVLPGTVHSVSLELYVSKKMRFLKLGTCRGWLPDRHKGVLLVQQIPQWTCDDDDVPRRRQHRRCHLLPRLEANVRPTTVSPVSNISVLTEDDSSSYHSLLAVADEEARKTIYLLRIQAASLSILDAPHFQVNHLIHGNHNHNNTTTPSLFASRQKNRTLSRHTLVETLQPVPTQFSIKTTMLALADKSGWLVLSNVNDAQVVGTAAANAVEWGRVQPRAGIAVYVLHDEDLDADNTSPTSSFASSSIGSSFLDVVFRNNTKKDGSSSTTTATTTPSILPCGTCVDICQQQGDNDEYCRLQRGGWIPRTAIRVLIQPPTIEQGSFWFRVLTPCRARQGPSSKAPSIQGRGGSQTLKFECGEFVRASQILQLDERKQYAKLYRNRHVRLEASSLAMMTAPSEWVPIVASETVYLEPCITAPQLERDTWRYNVVCEDGVAVRKGPSYHAHATGELLFGGESLVIRERVTTKDDDDKVVWLKLQSGEWVPSQDDNGTILCIPHALRHRQHGTPAYDALVARLFPKDSQEEEEESQG